MLIASDQTVSNRSSSSCCLSNPLYDTQCSVIVFLFFFFQAEDGIRDLVRSRGLGDVYKRQAIHAAAGTMALAEEQF